MIEIVENTGHAGGYATIVIRASIPTGVTIAGIQIRRSGTETNVLGPRGWQAKPAVLQPRSIEIDDLGATVEIGPDIVDSIAPDTPVTIVICGPDFKRELFWPYITPSPYNNPDRFNASRPKASPAPMEPDRVEAPPEETVEKEADSAKGQTERKAPPYALVGSLIAVMVICIGLVWWFSDPGEQTVPQTPVISFEERYRQLLETDETGQDLLELYREIGQSENFDGNIAFQALQAAAVKKSNAEAHMGIAALYDPLTYDDRFFSAPNPTQAAVEYDKALALGNAAAGEAKRAMCAAARTPAAEFAEAFASFDTTVSCQ